MKDGLGNPVYPIIYNGTTYLPIRAVSNMLDIPVAWDATTKTVILGTEEKPPRSVLKFVAKTSDLASKVTDKDSLRVKDSSGKEFVYNDGISYRMASGVWSANIDSSYKAKIGGTYSKLSFDVYIDAFDNYKDDEFVVYVYNVDTEGKLADIRVAAGEIKKVEDIDITGVDTLGFTAKCVKGYGYAGNAYFSILP